MVVRLAIAKAEAADAGPADIVIAADTAVVADEHVLGKPADRDDCLAMLGLLSGRAHQVMTGVAVTSRTWAVVIAGSRSVSEQRVISRARRTASA